MSVRWPFPETGDDVIASLRPHLTAILCNATREQAPFFVHTLGAPGAGKSSLVAALQHELPETRRPAVVAFDRLMAALPEYQRQTDRVEAFRLYEGPARAAGYALLRELVDRRSDILLDHSGAFANHVTMLEHVKGQGYKVVVLHVLTDIDAAKRRVAARAETEGRHTPLDYVDQRDAIVRDLAPAYRAVADCYFEISNDQASTDWLEHMADQCRAICAEIMKEER